MPDQIALGKQPKNSDSRTISLPALVTNKTETEADAENGTGITDWMKLGNDTTEDCTCAAAGHAEMLWADSFPVHMAAPTKEQILTAYADITGYTPEDPSTDKGADILTVLKYWKATGIAGQKIGAFAEIPTYDIETIKWSIARLGLAYIGLQLPAAWMVAHQRANVTPAAVAEGPGGDPESFTTVRRWLRPATWQNPFNGHCVIYSGYSPAGFTCVSWGTTMQVSLGFHLAYCDEAYAIIPPEMADGTFSVLDLIPQRVHDALEWIRTADSLMAKE